MFFSFFYHLFSLDFAWILQLILLNLHWLLAFTVMMYFFTGGKGFVRATLVLIFNVWALLDFMNFLGWFGFVAGFLFLNYGMKLSLFAFLSETPQANRYAIAITEFAAFGIWAYYNLVIVGVQYGFS